MTKTSVMLLSLAVSWFGLVISPAAARAYGSGPNIRVNKTAFVNGENVCGTITIRNTGGEPAVLTNVVDYLEVHFPQSMTPPPLPAGSTPNWFMVAEVPVPLPGPIAPGATALIEYCFSLCLAEDSPGANSMRNVVTVTLANGPQGLTTTRSRGFAPPVLDCRACCLPDGSCTDTRPADCGVAGGLSQAQDSDCATTACNQACCLGNGQCEDTITTLCALASGTPLGLATQCATAECPSACCLPNGSCAMMLTSDCQVAGGGSQGPDADCATIECPQACCYPDESCTDDPPSSCQAAGGESKGLGTTCAASPCCVPHFGSCSTFADCCDSVGCNNGLCCNRLGAECGGDEGPCCDWDRAAAFLISARVAARLPTAAVVIATTGSAATRWASSVAETRVPAATTTQSVAARWDRAAAFLLSARAAARLPTAAVVIATTGSAATRWASSVAGTRVPAATRMQSVPQACAVFPRCVHVVHTSSAALGYAASVCARTPSALEVSRWGAAPRPPPA